MEESANILANVSIGKPQGRTANICEFAAQRSTSTLVLLVFGSSVLVTLFFWTLLPDRFRLPANEPNDHQTFYAPVARSILAGRGVSWEDGTPATLVPPGWPLILSGLFRLSRSLGISEASTLSAFGILAMAAISSFVFLLGRILLSVSASLASAVIWITYPFAQWLTGQPNSEIPFMLFLYAGLALFWYLLIRRRRARALFLLCGSVLGIAMLIRPIAIGIALVLGVVTWVVRRDLSRRSRVLLITMLLCGNLLALLPWEAWVYSKTGKVISISTSGNENLRDGLMFAINRTGNRRQLIFRDVDLVVRELQTQLDDTGRSYQEIGAVVANQLKAHPLAMAKLFALKIGRSWYGTESGRHELTILFINLAYLIMIAWAARKVWRQGGSFRKFAIGTLLVVMYFWGMTVLAISMARYMVPVMGLLFPLIGAALFPRSAAEARPA